PAAKDTMHAIGQEIELTAEQPSQGAAHIAARLSSRPLHYLSWYLFQKPYELWGWEVGIGQRDIYVYPTRNSPFDVNTGFVVIAALAKSMTPWRSEERRVGKECRSGVWTGQEKKRRVAKEEYERARE